MHGPSGSGSAAPDDASLSWRAHRNSDGPPRGRRIPGSIRPLESSPGLPGSHDNPLFGGNEVVSRDVGCLWNRIRVAGEASPRNASRPLPTKSAPLWLRSGTGPAPGLARMKTNWVPSAEKSPGDGNVINRFRAKREF